MSCRLLLPTWLCLPHPLPSRDFQQHQWAQEPPGVLGLPTWVSVTQVWKQTGTRSLKFQGLFCIGAVLSSGKKKKKRHCCYPRGFFPQFSLYCAGTNNQAPSGPCEPGYFCTGGAKNALQHVVVEGHYSLAGAFKPEPCPLGTFQPMSTSGLQPGGSAEPLETAKMCE